MGGVDLDRRDDAFCRHIVGGPELSYGGDMTYLSLVLGGFIAVFIVATLFVPKLVWRGPSRSMDI